MNRFLLSSLCFGFISLCFASGNELLELEQENYGTKIHQIDDANIRLDSFNKSVKWSKYKNEVEVISCDKLLLISLQTSRGNSSYGGLCSLKTNEGIETAYVCNDDMVGHFSIKKINKESYSNINLAKYIYQNCYGG